MKNVQQLSNDEQIALEGGVTSGGCIPHPGPKFPDSPQIPIIKFGDPRDFGGKLYS